ncbi:MAG: hypothetical protein IPO19_14780 [Rhodoferax sp.]|nr:hypothetical protein [Rhodoferax sp.]
MAKYLTVNQATVLANQMLSLAKGGAVARAAGTDDGGLGAGAARGGAGPPARWSQTRT